MTPTTAAHPTSELFPLLHFPRIVVNQEALGAAEVGSHGLRQELQNDALEQVESGQDLSSSAERRENCHNSPLVTPLWEGGKFG